MPPVALRDGPVEFGEDASDAHWVTPRLVGEVTFGEWTGSGRLRHPVWRGWRVDKEPDEVVPEA